MRLENKVVAITGAGAGMGLAIARRFATEGARLALTDINGEALARAEEELRQQGAAVTSRVGNVAREQDVETLLDAALTVHGRLDCLINNAGVLDSLTPVADTSSELYQRVMSVNADGVFYGCRGAVRRMLEQDPRGGNIINISSAAGLYGHRGGAAYTMSKHAVIGLTRNTAAAYYADGIRCNAICPGGIDTDIQRDEDFHPSGLERTMRVAALMPNRMGRPEEIASTALFLASDEASYVNGAALTVCGGWLAF